MLRQILVAVDFSVWSRDAAQHALDMARAISGGVTLLHVLEAHETGSLDLEAARTLLQQLSLLARRPPRCLIVSARRGSSGQERLAADGPGRRARIGDGIAPTILAVAERLGTELIVIGLHGQGSRGERTLGQVAQQVLLDAHTPVQVVPCITRRHTAGRWSEALTELAAFLTRCDSA